MGSQKISALDSLQRSNSAPSRRRSFQALLSRAHGSPKRDLESLKEEDEDFPPILGTLSSSSAAGPLALLSVAFFWGSYSPTLKVLYSLPGPPDPAALTAARGVIQASALWATNWWISKPAAGNHKSKEQATGASAWKAGIELGFWNFLATSLQAIGLERTTAVRGAFIIQATAILTPLLATLTGEWPSRSVWVGCMIALGSTVLITLDSVAPGQQLGAASLISVGDAACLGAALFYSVATVRLGFYAQQLPAIPLASAKSTALAVWALVWFSYLAARHAASGDPVGALWEGRTEPFAWLLVFWSALGPGALAAFLQTKGQSSVPSSQAQVYYGSTPIWSALLAMLLLRGEGMGPVGWLGGAGIVLAGLVASR